MTHKIQRNNNTPVAEIQVGGVCNPARHFNKYVVIVEFMIGDADGSVIRAREFATGEEDLLVEFLNFLNDCAIHFPSGKGGYDNYRKVPGYRDWIYDEELELDLEEEGGEPRLDDDIDRLIEWPMVDGEYWTSFDEAHVIYYDQHGHQHAVAMITND